MLVGGATLFIFVMNGQVTPCLQLFTFISGFTYHY